MACLAKHDWATYEWCGKGCRVVIKFGMVVLAWPGPPLGVHWLARCVCIWSVVG